MLVNSGNIPDVDIACKMSSSRFLVFLCFFKVFSITIDIHTVPRVRVFYFTDNTAGGPCPSTVFCREKLLSYNTVVIKQLLAVLTKIIVPVLLM